MQETAESGDPVVCGDSFFQEGKTFLICNLKFRHHLPHEESLSQNPAISYAHGNH
jgi:hypothetical protein